MKNAKKITEKEIKKASKLSPAELSFINETAYRVMQEGPRIIVIMALCSHIAGSIVRDSNGVLSSKEVLAWIKRLMQTND